MKAQSPHSEVWIRETPSSLFTKFEEANRAAISKVFFAPHSGKSCKSLRMDEVVVHLRIDTTEQSRNPNQSSIVQNVQCFQLLCNHF